MRKQSNARVILFAEGTNEVLVQKVVDADANMVETESGIYNIENAETYVDSQAGSLVYVFNANIPARIESENLKLLRRNVVLKQLFKFERNTGGIDWLKIMPYIIIVMMVLFNK